jgi:hypothetical protein
MIEGKDSSKLCVIIVRHKIGSDFGGVRLRRSSAVANDDWWLSQDSVI